MLCCQPRAILNAFPAELQKLNKKTGNLPDGEEQDMDDFRLQLRRKMDKTRNHMKSTKHSRCSLRRPVLGFGSGRSLVAAPPR